MHSKLVIFAVLALVVLVFARTKPDGSKGKGGKRHQDRNFPLKTCLAEEALALAMEIDNGTRTGTGTGTGTGPVAAFRDKIMAAMKPCVEEIINKSSNSSMSHSNDHKGQGDPHGDGHGHGHGQGHGNGNGNIATYMCVTACALTKIGMLSADGTQFNRSAIYEIVQLGMVKQVQEKYMEEVDNCLSTQKISLSHVTLGDRCEELEPYMKCIDVAANATCPAPATVGSTPLTPANDDDEVDENN